LCYSLLAVVVFLFIDFCV